MVTDILAALYFSAVAIIATYGLLGLFTLTVYSIHRRQERPLPAAPAIWPRVTVQLPLYNERYVVERLINAAVALDYPSDKLQIQVVDDSTDETTYRAARLVAKYRARGVHITLHHRQHRTGYKAGALAAALAPSAGDFIALFDADFEPKPDFLRRTIPYFLADPTLGVIQARWGHSNDQASPLTAAQAIAIDKHFAIEQVVRHRANYFPKFNGSASVLRRQCVDEAGGWHGDTVTEDLCLSTRAVLSGWRFEFLPNLVAPAQLPASIAAYKSQQARWAQGSLQCLRKYGWQMLQASDESLTGRLYALLSMSAYLTNICVLVMLLLLLPLVALGYEFSPNLIFLSLAGVGQPILFGLSQKELYNDWRCRLRYLPMLLIIALGLAPSNSRALWQAFTGVERPFVRTPKQKAGSVTTPQRYRASSDWIIGAEILLAFYALAGVLLCISQATFGPVFFFAICSAGFGYVAYLTLQEQYQQRSWAIESVTES